MVRDGLWKVYVAVDPTRAFEGLEFADDAEEIQGFAGFGRWGRGRGG